jgi:hypothetical protein
MNISCKLPSKCPIKNVHKNKPVIAIQYFLAIDDFNMEELLINLIFSLQR